MHMAYLKRRFTSLNNDITPFIWVDSYARNHEIPLEWAKKGVRKEDYID